MHSFSITDYGLAAIVLPHNLASESLGVGYSGSSLLLMQEYWIRIWHHVLCYLNNYFNLNVCLSILGLSDVCLSVSRTYEFVIPAVRSQNVTNKSCLVCVKSEKYAFLVTLRFLGSMR